MKKTIITVFLIIAVLIIALMAFNVATNGKVWKTIGNAVAKPINTAWKGVTDSDDNLIEVNSILDDSINTNGTQSIGGLTTNSK